MLFEIADSLKYQEEVLKISQELCQRIHHNMKSYIRTIILASLVLSVILVLHIIMSNQAIQIKP